MKPKFKKGDYVAFIRDHAKAVNDDRVYKIRCLSLNGPKEAWFYTLHGNKNPFHHEKILIRYKPKFNEGQKVRLGGGIVSRVISIHLHDTGFLYLLEGSNRKIHVNFLGVYLPPVAENLFRLRAEKQLSQTKLAKLSGLQPSTISHFERGTREPSLKNLVKLCKALGCSSDHLIGLEKLSESETKLDKIRRIINE